MWKLKLWYFYWNAQFAIGRDSLARSFTYVQNMTKFLSFQEKSIENMVVAISGKICVFNNCFLLSWTSLLLPFSHDNSASFAIFSYVIDIYAVIRFFHLNTKSNYWRRMLTVQILRKINLTLETFYLKYCTNCFLFEHVWRFQLPNVVENYGHSTKFIP